MGRSSLSSWGGDVNQQSRTGKEGTLSITLLEIQVAQSSHVVTPATPLTFFVILRVYILAISETAGGRDALQSAVTLVTNVTSALAETKKPITVDELLDADHVPLCSLQA